MCFVSYRSLFCSNILFIFIRTCFVLKFVSFIRECFVLIYFLLLLLYKFRLAEDSSIVIGVQRWSNYTTEEYNLLASSANRANAGLLARGANSIAISLRKRHIKSTEESLADKKVILIYIYIIFYIYVYICIYIYIYIHYIYVYILYIFYIYIYIFNVISDCQAAEIKRAEELAKMAARAERDRSAQAAARDQRRAIESYSEEEEEYSSDYDSDGEFGNSSIRETRSTPAPIAVATSVEHAVPTEADVAKLLEEAADKKAALVDPTPKNLLISFAGTYVFYL